MKHEHTYYSTPDERSREVLSPGLVIIVAADLPADLVRRSEVGRAIGADRSIDRSIDRLIDRDDRASEAEGPGITGERAAQAEPARFTRRSTRSHRRKHDVGIHVAADYAPSSARFARYTQV